MNKQKNILLIMPYGSVGGMERLAYNFYKCYIGMGYNVKALKLIKLDSDIINFGADELYLKDCDFSEMSKTERAFFSFQAPSMIKKIIKREQITHSISFGDMANFFSSLSGTKEFKIGSIHALKSIEFENKTFLNKVFKWSYRTTYKNFDKLVCISNAIKTDLLKKCGYKFESNLEVIYNPHNFDDILKLSAEPLESEKEIEIFSNSVILFLGRISVQKSPWHLIKAFSLLKDKHPNTILVFIGDGDQNVQAEVERLITKLNLSQKVHFLGRKKNPYKYLNKAKVLVLSSHYEGTPNVIVEAISLNIPVVTSHCTQGIIEMMSTKSIPEQQQNIEVEGGIVTPNLFKGKLGIPSSDDIIDEEIVFSEALSKVLSSEETFQRLQKNKAILLEKFELNKVVTKYLN